MGPIRKLRLMRAASKYIDLWVDWSENDMLTNTSKTTKVFQILALIGQGLNAFGGFIPVEYQPFVMIALTAMQGIQAQIAHRSNPDGTLALKPGSIGAPPNPAPKA